MKRIRNKNTGAEYSSPTLQYDNSDKEDCGYYVDNSDNTFCATDIDWEEVKEDNSTIEAAAEELSKEILGEWNEEEETEYDYNSRVLVPRIFFIKGAIWMRDKYLKDNGLNKVFEDLDNKQWHDLRKNPNDLPKDTDKEYCKVYGGSTSGLKLCKLDDSIEEQGFAVMRYDNDSEMWLDDIRDSRFVIAWRELPEFKE